jgi:hypothetical protein
MNLTKTLLFAVATLIFSSPAYGASQVGKDCTWNGIRLAGKVKIVDRKHNPDFTIKIVEHFSDMKIKMVEHFPDRCGEWQVVDHNQDFTVAIVTGRHDLKVKWENHFPGVTR